MTCFATNTLPTLLQETVGPSSLRVKSTKTFSEVGQNYFKLEVKPTKTWQTVLKMQKLLCVKTPHPVAIK